MGSTAEDTAIEITQSEQRENRVKKQKSLRDLCEYNKTSTVHITGVPGEEREGSAGKVP